MRKVGDHAMVVTGRLFKVSLCVCSCENSAYNLGKAAPIIDHEVIYFTSVKSPCGGLPLHNYLLSPFGHLFLYLYNFSLYHLSALRLSRCDTVRMSEHFDPWSLNSPSIFAVPFVLDSLNSPFYFHSLHTILFFIIFTIFCLLCISSKAFSPSFLQ